MKRASRMLVSLSILVAILLTALPLTFAYDVIEREIIEYEYTLRQTSTSDDLPCTRAAERINNYGRMIPAINRVNSTNASHNIYFKLGSQREWIVESGPRRHNYPGKIVP